MYEYDNVLITNRGQPVKRRIMLGAGQAQRVAKERRSTSGAYSCLYCVHLWFCNLCLDREGYSPSAVT